MRWSKALQRRLAADEAWMVVRKFMDKGNRTSQFMLRPGEGRWCLGKALRTVPGSAATILLKAVSKTLETKQVLHKWYPAKHSSDKCDLCKQQCETVAHVALACPVLSDATTAAHDKLRTRFSNALEMGLGDGGLGILLGDLSGGCISGIAMSDRGGYVGERRLE